MKANCRIRPISLFLAGYSSLWVSKEEKRRKWHETCKRKVSLLFVFYTTAPLMRWAKKGKTLNQLRIDCNSQLFFFSPLFLAWPPFVTELSLWINILYFLHENNLSWKWMKKNCNRHNNNTIPESVYESINQGEAVFCSLYNRKQIESLLVI